MIYLSRLAQFILGVLLGIALLTVGGLATARYLIEQFTITPPRPVFAEEQPQPEAQPSPAPEPETPQPVAAEPTPTPSPSPTPPKGYEARVTWPQGLIVRGAPSGDAASVGGVDFNVAVRVIATSQDGNWEQISWNGQEGWVKAGNLEKTADQDSQ
jgi:hypothetical protein